MVLVSTPMGITREAAVSSASAEPVGARYPEAWVTFNTSPLIRAVSLKLSREFTVGSPLG